MIKLPADLREIHNLTDDLYAKDTEEYDYLRTRYPLYFPQNHTAILADIERLSAPIKNDPPPVYEEHSLKDAVNYGLHGTRLLGKYFLRTSIEFHQALVDALPAHAELRCKVAHRTLRMLDSMILWNPNKGEALSQRDIILAPVRLFESLLPAHSGDYVVDLAEAHALAHIDEGLARDKDETLQTMAEILGSLQPDLTSCTDPRIPLHTKLTKIFEDNGGVAPLPGGKPGTQPSAQTTAPV